MTWYASEEIFESTHYNLETITSRLREMAFLNKGVEFVVRDEREDAESRVDAVQADTIANQLWRQEIPFDELSGDENDKHDQHRNPIGPELDERHADRRHAADEGSDEGNEAQQTGA